MPSKRVKVPAPPAQSNKTTQIVFDHLYTWVGGLSWFMSVEKNCRVKLGEVRRIRGKLFYIWALNPIGWSSAECFWVPVRDKSNEPECMKSFRNSL